jgi:hypothetical protein
MTLPRFQLAATLGAITILVSAPPAWSQQLGGAPPVDIPIVQILAGLVLCLFAAFAAALVLKRRSGLKSSAFRRLLGRAVKQDDGIAVLETRRLSPHADACRFTSGNREYVVVVTSSSCTVVSDTELPSTNARDSTETPV